MHFNCLDKNSLNALVSKEILSFLKQWEDLTFDLFILKRCLELQVKVLRQSLVDLVCRERNDDWPDVLEQHLDFAGLLADLLSVRIVEHPELFYVD